MHEIQNEVINNDLISLKWIKAHVGYKGNEKANQLAKDATEKI